MQECSSPVFVRGMSRSGGTLMCTLLDAHRDFAVSYELYPDLLKTEETLDLAAFADRVEGAHNLKAAGKLCPTERFGLFLIRCQRGALNHHDFARFLRVIADEGRSFDTADGRLRMVELCGLEKMHREGKSRWGVKLSGGYEDYLDFWPEARFLDMLRDGRDVLASQIRMMKRFDKTPAEVGESWVKTHQRFEQLIQDRGGQGYMVRYETLANHPEDELRRICAFLDVELDEAMLRHNELDLTIFKVNHLSGPRISRAIDTTKIGRWKEDLTEPQVEGFLSTAAEGLKHFGYQ